jgi:trimeric autotransporter adhesin
MPQRMVILSAVLLLWPAANRAAGPKPPLGSQQTAKASAAQAGAAQPRPVTNTTGQVRTETGESVPGATVRITNKDTQKVWLSWTDESGKFVFPELPEGYYHIEVTQIGFKAAAIDVKLPVIPSGRIPIVLDVATLAELAPSQPPPEKPSSPPAAAAANPAANASAQNREGQNAQPATSPGRGGNQPATAPRPGQGQAAANRGRPSARRGQIPAGITNAIQQGMATGGFQQTDLTGAGAGAQENENAGQPSDNGATGTVSGGNAPGASSNSFLRQGTVGQQMAGNAPGGFGGAPGGFGAGGPGELAPGAPAGPGGAGGSPFGAQGRAGGGAPGGAGRGGGRGGLGGGGRFGGQFAGGPGGGPPGGIFAGRARLMRQAANRMRFAFYDQYANSALNARPYSITGQEFPKISNYNQRFGANLGGPLKFPHVYDGSDRTYFFLNYQHQLIKNGINAFSLVPTADERNGDFCNVGNGFTLYNPYSNLSDPSSPRAVLGDGCHLPSGMENSAAIGLLPYFPLPNIAEEVGPTGQTFNYLLQATTPENSDIANLHILHTLNSRLSLNGGYNFNSQRENTLGNFLSTAGTQSTLSQNVNVTLNHNWTSDMVESTGINWSRNRVRILSDNSFVNNIAGELGIMGVSTAPINYGLPEIQFASLGSLNDPVPSLVRNQTARFMEAWTYTHGAHTIRFGGEIRRIQLNTDSDPNPRGRFMFTGQMTSQVDSAGQSLATPETQPFYEFADFLLGLPYNTQIRTGDANTYFRSWEFIGYGQDDWRVTKTFTVLYGMRYTAVTPPIEIYDHISNLDLSPLINAALVVTPGETGPFYGTYPRALIHGDYRNFGPRIGFAWLPPVKPRTVVRAGYSIFYNDSIYNTLAQDYLAYQPPFAESSNLYTSSTQLLTLQNGFPSAAAAVICSPSSPPPPATNCTVPNTSGVLPFYKDAYAQIWMLSTETDLRPNWILTLTYTGTKGTNLDLLNAPNRAPLGTNPLETQSKLAIPYALAFDYDQSGADSLYNALQVRLVHRFTRGIMLQAFYTFSKSLDNASSIGGSSPIVVQEYGNYSAEWGLSSFDKRHQVRLMSLWELPVGERHRYLSRGWGNRIFGDWRLMNLITWNTGTPFTAYLGGGASNNTGTGANFSERAEQVGDPNVGLCGGSALDFFNARAFAVPPSGTYGNQRRGSIEGPCSFSWNVSLAKSFRFGPRERQHSVMARWEVQNLSNTPTFTGLATTVGSSLFGQVTSAGSMRTMDVMLRFNF